MVLLTREHKNKPHKHHIHPKPFAAHAHPGLRAGAAPERGHTQQPTQQHPAPSRDRGARRGQAQGAFRVGGLLVPAQPAAGLPLWRGARQQRRRGQRGQRGVGAADVRVTKQQGEEEQEAEERAVVVLLEEARLARGTGRLAAIGPVRHVCPRLRRRLDLGPRAWPAPKVCPVISLSLSFSSSHTRPYLLFETFRGCGHPSQDEQDSVLFD